MLIIVGQKHFEKAVAKLHAELAQQVQDDLKGIKSVADLSSRVRELREQVEKLEIEKGRKQEEFGRKEREIEHKVGLERKRQEFEIEASKREATVSVREENLKADRKRFEEAMKFQNDRFTNEVNYLKETLAEIVKRLPSAEFTADLSARAGRKR